LLPVIVFWFVTIGTFWKVQRLYEEAFEEWFAGPATASDTVVVRAPAGSLGVFLARGTSHRVTEVRSGSPLAGEVAVGDRLVSISTPGRALFTCGPTATGLDIVDELRAGAGSDGRVLTFARGGVINHVEFQPRGDGHHLLLWFVGKDKAAAQKKHEEEVRARLEAQYDRKGGSDESKKMLMKKLRQQYNEQVLAGGPLRDWLDDHSAMQCNTYTYTYQEGVLLDNAEYRGHVSISGNPQTFEAMAAQCGADSECIGIWQRVSGEYVPLYPGDRSWRGTDSFPSGLPNDTVKQVWKKIESLEGGSGVSCDTSTSVYEVTVDSCQCAEAATPVEVKADVAEE